MIKSNVRGLRASSLSRTFTESSVTQGNFRYRTFGLQLKSSIFSLFKVTDSLSKGTLFNILETGMLHLHIKNDMDSFYNLVFHFEFCATLGKLKVGVFFIWWHLDKIDIWLLAFDLIRKLETMLKRDIWHHFYCILRKHRWMLIVKYRAFLWCCQKYETGIARFPLFIIDK